MSNKIGMSLKLSGIALAVGQAFAPSAFAQQADAAVVVVTGIRASAQSSVAIKRDATEVVESITAEDIGKLPDPNVAETLTRIPGVQGYRYGGEGASPVGQGSGLTIRGLSGQTASQINGRSVFTAGGREFNIEDAIPGMVAGIDVYKNPSAEHIEGGIGGLVNIRTRNPSDFKGPVFTVAANARYNDLAKKTDPELFALAANKWDLGGGQRIGVMAAIVSQKSAGRSDNNPANGGANFKRAIRADSAEYATLAAANTANSANAPRAAYVGRSDISFLTGVPTVAGAPSNTPNLSGLTADQAANVMVAPGLTSNVFQETILRERNGLNLAADYRVSNTLRFYSELNYVKYVYHQQYRGLNSSDGGNVKNLQTTPFNFTEGLANRNSNGGSDDVLVSKRLLGGTFLDSTVNTMGGIELSPYKTWVGAAGAEWSPTPSLALKGDFSYVKSTKSTDNRDVVMQSAPGLTWSTTRVADGAPHGLTFAGPSLADPANFVYQDYTNGNNSKNNDSGYALALSGAYTLDDGMITKLRFGTRAAHQQDDFHNYSFYGRPMTTDGKPLTASRSNAISVASMGSVEAAPDNFMRGKAGYAGGYVVYAPEALTGNQVATAFPTAGILPQGSYVENISAHSYNAENTLAGYLVGDFQALDERLKGNVGVRVVRTEATARANPPNTTGATTTFPEVSRTSSYVNVLPSLNATYDITKDFLARFGYGRGLTRAPLGMLNPSISVNATNGTGNAGTPDLHPQTADSFDFSLERYFSRTNYVSAALFDKQIKGFFNATVECQTVANAPAYSGSVANSCGTGQYLITKQVNSENGWARGVELAGQYFFDSSSGLLKNFGVSGSYTYLDTSNPVNFGSATNPRIVDTPQAFQSKHNYSLAGMYEDGKLSARLVYNWRSDSILFGVSANPIDARAIGAYGILDGSLSYEVANNVTLSFNASNITDKGLDRYVGEPGAYMTDIERQHYLNGRTFSIGLRYKFGN